MNLQRVLVMMLVAVMALTFTACTKEEAVDTTEATEEVAEEATEETEEVADDVEEAGAKVVGEGATTFTFEVVFEDESVHEYEVNTDKTVVGEALLDAGLIEGEESEYGLYVKTVDGVTVDFDTDGLYWGFLINGEMAATGVDQTEIVDGDSYTFAVTR